METREKIVAVLALLALCGACLADELYVPGQYSTIQAAIDAAYDGDTVMVANGTYTGEGNRDIDFKGKAITVRSESGPENCIIDCNGTESDPHRGFYFHNGEDANSILDGFTITNGNAPKKVISSDWHFYGGGAILCYRSSPTIKNCNIYDCDARQYGGGINCWWGSNPAITKCVISGNWAGCGGGIYCDESGPTITNCTITNNSAGEGGGISCLYWHSSPKIINCTISGNSVVGYGGGILCLEGSLTIINCIVANNSAHGGGGIYWIPVHSPDRRSTMIINYSTIKGNIAESGGWSAGGGICIDSGCRRYSLKILNSNIIANTARGERGTGGGICTRRGMGSSEFIIKNCKMTGNSATTHGGAIYFDSSGYFNITNCTISGNRAGDSGGIYSKLRVYEPGTASITNSILWDNFPQQMIEYYDQALVTYSDVQSGWEGEGNIDADPCFVEPGYWADVNDPNAVWAEGDYHLLRGSPCVDAGTDANNYSDIEGNARPFDFPGVDNNGKLPEFDMGAYELVPVEAKMQLTPQMLNCSGKGKWVKAHITIAEGFFPEDVDVNEPAITYPMEAESEYITIASGDKGPVRLEVVFGREAFCDSIIDDYLDVTVIGSLTTGEYFQGTDTIKVTNKGGKK